MIWVFWKFRTFGDRSECCISNIRVGALHTVALKGKTISICQA